MDTFMKFLYEFLNQFFKGFILFFKGLFNGVVEIFNIPAYIKVIRYYQSDLKGPEWIFVAIAVLAVVVLLVSIILLIYFVLRKYLKFRKTIVEQESLLEEVATLNNEVANLIQEKQDILAMKVSKLGLKPGDGDTEEVETQDEVAGDGQRFPQVASVVEALAKYKIQNVNNTFT